MIEVLTLFALTFGQGTMSTMSSRSRNRSSMYYHGTVQMISHTVWLLVLTHLISLDNIGLEQGVGYVLGYTAGSLNGAKISMFIEKKIGAVT